jgi:hypothetical protein
MRTQTLVRRLSGMAGSLGMDDGGGDRRLIIVLRDAPSGRFLRAWASPEGYQVSEAESSEAKGLSMDVGGSVAWQR